MRLALTLLSTLLLALGACAGGRPARQGPVGAPVQAKGAHAETPAAEAYTGKMIYVVVALCDNVNQGIVPVPAALGDGEDPARNLYWGARFSVKTFFGASREWQLLSAVQNPTPKVLERLVFKHRREEALLVADAYRGAEIKAATSDFLDAAAGLSGATAEVGGKTYNLSRGGASHMIAYVGHNGLMDFRLPRRPKGRQGDARRDAVILACASKGYFADAIKESGANPLLWTTNLMAPEAYVLKAAVDGWLAGEGGEQVRERAARQYHAYQKCGLGAARRLFATGW